MVPLKRKFDRLITKPKRENALREIIDYFRQERDENIWIIGAEEILDFLLDTVGEDIYNTAIEDAKNSLRDGFWSIEINLDSLQQK